MSPAGESIHVQLVNVGVLLFLFLIGRGVDYLPQAGLSASGWIIGFRLDYRPQIGLSASDWSITRGFGFGAGFVKSVLWAW